MIWFRITYGVSFLVLVFLLLGSVRAWQSPEYKRDMEKVRERRGIRKDAKKKRKLPIPW